MSLKVVVVVLLLLLVTHYKFVHIYAMKYRWQILTYVTNVSHLEKYLYSKYYILVGNSSSLVDILKYSYQ